MRTYLNDNHPIRFVLVTVIFVIVFLCVPSVFLLITANYNQEVSSDSLPLADASATEPASTSDWLPVTLEEHDTFNSIAEYFGIADSVLQEIFKTPDARTNLTQLKAGTTLNFLFNDEHELIGLKYSLTKRDTLILMRNGQQWTAIHSQSLFYINIMAAGLSSYMNTSEGQKEFFRDFICQWIYAFAEGVHLGRIIQKQWIADIGLSANNVPQTKIIPETLASLESKTPSSTIVTTARNPTPIKFLVLSAKQVHNSPRLYKQLQKIFKDVVNFNEELNGNSQTSILYDEFGHIELATLHLQHQTVQAVRYTNSAGHTLYYAPDGKLLRKPVFLASPVKFIRISDKFNLHRMHPVLHIARPHFGMDYAAPKGAPVHAVGAGKVAFRGWDGGYGRTIVISHDNKYQTLYAHLSHISNKLKPGQIITRGQVIGYVGSTGLATGPHLHFGLYKYGKAINPEFVLPKQNIALAVADKDLPNFLANTNRLLTQLALQQNYNHLHG